MNQTKTEAPAPVIQAPLPMPPYQISNVTRNFLEYEITNNHITYDDLDFIYDLGRRIARHLSHDRPTYQDVMSAAHMKNLEELTAVAEGTRELWIFLPGYGPSRAQTQNYRASIWKSIAVAVLAELAAK
jgi:hypothetical protein